MFLDREDGRPVLKRVKYMMVPVFWEEEVDDPSRWAMDAAQIDGVMARNRQEYMDMSWEKMTVEHDILPQQAFGVSKANPSWDDTSAAAKRLLEVNLGLEPGTDYDSIGLVYHLAQDGPFSGAGGWGCLNCDFLWMSYQIVSETRGRVQPFCRRPLNPSSHFISHCDTHLLFITGLWRHATRNRCESSRTERSKLASPAPSCLAFTCPLHRTSRSLQHNFGHPHHKKNSYQYRLTRPTMPEFHDGVELYDGWDMASCLRLFAYFARVNFSSK